MARTFILGQSSRYVIYTLCASALNYAIYPLVSRVLPPEGFGDVIVTTTIANQVFGILLAANVISFYLSRSRTKNAAQKSEAVQVIMFRIFLAVLLLLTFFVPAIQSLLDLGSYWYLVVLFVILLEGVPVMTWTGYMQGQGEIARSGLFALVNATLQFIFSAALVTIVGGVGVLLGVAIGQLVCLTIFSKTKGDNLPKLTAVLGKIGSDTKSFLSGARGYIASSIFVAILIYFVQSADLLYAKAFFPAAESGLFSGVFLAGRVVFFAGAVLVWSVLPKIDVPGSKRNIAVLLRCLLIILLVLAGSVIFLLLTSDVLFQYLLGDAYNKYAHSVYSAVMFKSLALIITFIPTYLLMTRNKHAAISALLLSLPTIVVFSTDVGLSDLNQRFTLAGAAGIGLFAAFIGALHVYAKKFKI